MHSLLATCTGLCTCQSIAIQIRCERRHEFHASLLFHRNSRHIYQYVNNVVLTSLFEIKSAMEFYKRML